MKTEDFKKGDIVFSTDKRSGNVYRGTITGCGKKTFTINHDNDEIYTSVHYHRNTAQDNYYMSFKKETV